MWKIKKISMGKPSTVITIEQIMIATVGFILSPFWVIKKMITFIATVHKVQTTPVTKRIKNR